MSTVLITGAGGLVGSEAATFYLAKGFRVVGIDNNMREELFGPDGSIMGNINSLRTMHSYVHQGIDIRNYMHVEDVFEKYNDDIVLIIHTAAQPSHDWSIGNPATDFAINAVGTFNMLELTRRYCPEAPFIFTSTNKVYGDRPNHLNLVEGDTRWFLEDGCTHGINERMSIDQCEHGIFGASKVAADIMVQEYSKNFGLTTGVFRCGCLTGSLHAGVKLHGFLAYLVKCAADGTHYVINGYKGKQVRDNIHSRDLIAAFDAWFQAPISDVYNMGGGVFSNCSILEAIQIIEEELGRKVDYSISDIPRVCDHKWWISDVSKFMSYYPDWQPTMTTVDIIREIGATYNLLH